LQISGFCVSIVAIFFLTPFIIEKIGDYYYGLWVLITTITGYFGLSEFGITSATQNHLSICLGNNDEVGYRRIFSNSLYLYVIICCFIMLLVFISSIVILCSNRFKESDLVSGVLFITGMNMSISFLFYPYVSVLTSHIRLDITAIVAILVIVVNFGLTLIVISLGFGIMGMAIAALCSGLIGNLFLMIEAKKQVSGLRFYRSHITRKDLKSLFLYSRKTFLGQISQILRFKVSELVTGALISVNMVTHYSIANRLVAWPNNISMRLVSVLDPLMAYYVGAGDSNRIQKTFILSLKLFACLSIFVYSCLIILGKPFIILWLGEIFLDAYEPMVILGAGLCTAMMQAPVVSLFYATNKHQYFVYMNLLEGISNLALSILFVLTFNMGLVGVALGFFIPIFICKIFVQPFIVSKIFDIALKNFYGILIKIAMLSLVMYGIYFYLITELYLSSYLGLFINVLLLFIMFLFQLFLVLNKDERVLLRNLLLGGMTLFKKN
jgi:O-antigen/teichoic acid export membrane protein